jgi:GTP-binding protein
MSPPARFSGGDRSRDSDSRGAGRARRPGQRYRFATSTHQAPREWEPGGDGQEPGHGARAQAHRRRGHGRRAQRRQEHAALRRFRGTAQDRGLSVHDAGAEPRRCRSPGRAPSSWPTFPASSKGPSRKRLGLQFLRHVERTRLLAFLVPLDAEDPQQVYDRLRTEWRYGSCWRPAPISSY